MFEQTLPGDTKSALAILGESKLLKNAYLAGGTALALRINHRISYDLDFFTSENLDVSFYIQKLGDLGFKLDRQSEGTILGNIKNTKFSLFYYKYPLIDQVDIYQNIGIVGLKDLAAMKINAISSRGTKRDFVDLYYLAKQFSLEEMIDFYDQKFSTLAVNRIHLLKSLCYFDDAENDPDPNIISDEFDWNKIKDFFTGKTRSLIEH
jgi:predicted nucleotidyltransferase component of viral defense system